MNAEIIAVGTELLLGHTINTDAAYVARELSDIGVNLLFSSTVGDNPERLHAAVKQALSRSDLLVTTGGLGPTEDDLTKQTVAQARKGRPGCRRAAPFLPMSSERRRAVHLKPMPEKL